MILAGDVGATKILLEAGELRSGRWEVALSRRYESADVSLSDAVGLFLEEMRAALKARSRITAAGFGAAGPRIGNCIKMTYRPWPVDGDALAKCHRIPRVRVVNDLEATAKGLPLLGSRDQVTLQPGKADETAPRVVLGVGTGLGVAYLVPCGGELTTVAGEGGHAGFAPATPQQAELWHALQEIRGRVSVEDIVSGRGIARVYEAMARRESCPPSEVESLDPGKISAAGLERSDPVSTLALDLFVECLGSTAGDHALNVMARGGVYLAGGVVGKILPALKGERFRAAFCAKGAHSGLLKRIPVRAVTSERLGVLGAARVAAER